MILLELRPEDVLDELSFWRYVNILVPRRRNSKNTQAMIKELAAIVECDQIRQHRDRLRPENSQFRHAIVAADPDRQVKEIDSVARCLQSSQRQRNERVVDAAGSLPRDLRRSCRGLAVEDHPIHARVRRPVVYSVTRPLYLF